VFATSSVNSLSEQSFAISDGVLADQLSMTSLLIWAQMQGRAEATWTRRSTSVGDNAADGSKLVDDAVEAIPGIAQARHNVRLLVEALVHGSHHHFDISAVRGVVFHGLNAFGSGEQAHAGDI